MLFVTTYVGFIQDKLEAYELQNRFLNKEILELHSVRLEDEQRMAELNRYFNIFLAL